MKKEMPSARPFAYNPSSSQVIPGTLQIGDLAIGVEPIDYSGGVGGVKWWNGPDEDLGYVIAQSVPEGNQPAPGGITASIGFFRTNEKTEESFVELANMIQNGVTETFTTGDEARTWLNDNGYWTSFQSSEDPDAIAFLELAQIQDPVIKLAIDNLVKSLKTNGIWDLLDAFYPFAGNTSGQQRLNLIPNRQYDITFQGGWTHTANGAKGSTTTTGTTNWLPQPRSGGLLMGCHVLGSVQSSYNVFLGSRIRTGTSDFYLLDTNNNDFRIWVNGIGLENFGAFTARERIYCLSALSPVSGGASTKRVRPGYTTGNSNYTPVNTVVSNLPDETNPDNSILIGARWDGFFSQALFRSVWLGKWIETDEKMDLLIEIVENYYKDVRVSDPVISPQVSSKRSAPIVTISSSTPGAEIRYTLGSATPNSSSTLYVGPFQLNFNTQINVIALKPGMADSQVISVRYFKEPKEVISANIYNNCIHRDNFISRGRMNFVDRFETFAVVVRAYSGGSPILAIIRSASQTQMLGVHRSVNDAVSFEYKRIPNITTAFAGITDTTKFIADRGDLAIVHANAGVDPTKPCIAISRDKGNTWESLVVAGITVSTSWTEVAVSPMGNNIFVGTILNDSGQNRGAWVSQDYGNTWTQVQGPTSLFRQFRNPCWNKDGSKLIVAVESTSFNINSARISLNGGLTFNNLPRSTDGFAFAFSDLDRIFSVKVSGTSGLVDSNNSMWYSDDNGQTWTAVPVPNPQSFTSVECQGITVTARSNISNISRISYDHGVNWEILSNTATLHHIAYEKQAFVPVVTPAAGTVSQFTVLDIQNLNTFGVIRYTTDGSDVTESSPVFTEAFVLESSVTIKARIYSDDPEFFDSFMVTRVFDVIPFSAAPTIDPIQLVFETSATVTITTNEPDGLTYYTLNGSEPTQSSTLYTTPFTITDSAYVRAKTFKTGKLPNEATPGNFAKIKQIALAATFSNTATQNQIYQSNNQGATWFEVFPFGSGVYRRYSVIKISENSNAIQMMSLNTGNTDLRIHYSLNGGIFYSESTFQAPPLGASASIRSDKTGQICIARVDIGVGFPNIHISNDYGATYTPVNFDGQGGQGSAVGIDPENPLIMYVFTQGPSMSFGFSRLWKTENGGDTWAMIYENNFIRWRNPIVAAGGKIFTLTTNQNGSFVWGSMRSTDGGQTFTFVTVPSLSLGEQGDCSLTGDLLILSDSNVRFYRSTDFGLTFTDITPAQNDNLNVISVSPDGNRVLMGGNNRLYLSTNGGLTLSLISPHGSGTRNWRGAAIV
jgi:photosystem II stability/assembly factor-like uncharacterized protein